jgi:hypothetical protein
MNKPKFQLGQLVATPGALEAMQAAGQSPGYFLDRHVQGDWGMVCDDDKRANDQALVDGSSRGRRGRCRGHWGCARARAGRRMSSPRWGS